MKAFSSILQGKYINNTTKAYCIYFTLSKKNNSLINNMFQNMLIFKMSYFYYILQCSNNDLD